MASSAGRVGILGAMASEISALVDEMAVDEAGKSAGFEFWRGRLRERDCLIARCGMGKVAAAACVQRLIDEWNVSSVVLCGLAGGLRGDLRLGDIVVGESYVQHDVDASPIFPRFHIPGLGTDRLAAPAALTAAAFEAARAFATAGLAGSVGGETLARFGIEAPRVFKGLIATGDQFIADATREALRRDLPAALCVEMEGAAVAQVCTLNATPFVVVRVVSDKADAAAAADFSLFVDEVAPAFTRGIVGELLERLPRGG